MGRGAGIFPTTVPERRGNRERKRSLVNSWGGVTWVKRKGENYHTRGKRRGINSSLKRREKKS